MSNEKNTLPANEKGKKSKKFKASLAETFDSEFMEKVKTEEKIPDADFIAQKSDKEARKKIVKGMVDVKRAISHLNLIDIYRIFRETTMKRTFFPSSH